METELRSSNHIGMHINIKVKIEIKILLAGWSKIWFLSVFWKKNSNSCQWYINPSWVFTRVCFNESVVVMWSFRLTFVKFIVYFLFMSRSDLVLLYRRSSVCGFGRNVWCEPFSPPKIESGRGKIECHRERASERARGKKKVCCFIKLIYELRAHYRASFSITKPGKMKWVQISRGCIESSGTNRDGK